MKPDLVDERLLRDAVARRVSATNVDAGGGGWLVKIWTRSSNIATADGINEHVASEIEHFNVFGLAPFNHEPEVEKYAPPAAPRVAVRDVPVAAQM